MTIFVLALSAAAQAGQYVYQVNANGHPAVSPNDANTSGYADLETARTFDHRARGPWTAGDTVTLDPTGPRGAVFPTGGLIRPDAPAPLTFTPDGQGAVLAFDVTGGRAIVNLFGSGAHGITVGDAAVNHVGPRETVHVHGFALTPDHDFCLDYARPNNGASTSSPFLSLERIRPPHGEGVAT